MHQRSVGIVLRPGAALVLLALAACSGGGSLSAPPPPEVTVIQVQPQRAVVTTDYVASLEAANTVEIRPRVGGLLLQQAAVEGANVKAGDLLFRIDPQPYIAALAEAKAALAQAHASLEQAERDFARVEPLSALNAVSQQEVDAIVARRAAGRASVDAGRAAVKSAELDLEYTTVTSPIDGIVGRAQFRVGGLVTAYSSLLTTVYDTRTMYVNFSISERRMLELQHRFGISRDKPDVSRVFRILLVDGSEYAQPARLDFIDVAVDRTTGTLPIRLQLDNAAGALVAGQFARVQANSQEVPQALLVPQRAVQEIQGKTYLWVVAADNKVESRDVRMGARIGQDWLVEEGLKPGETVVTDGVQKLRPGIAVNPQPPGAPAAAARSGAGAQP